MNTAISDRLIDEFKLIQVYDEDYRIEARRELAKRSHMSVGKKDGLITIEVEDKSPERAAALAARPSGVRSEANCAALPAAEPMSPSASPK